MSQEDNELEKLKAKRLAEMEKNLSSQRQQKEFQSSQEEEKKTNQLTVRLLLSAWVTEVWKYYKTLNINFQRKLKLLYKNLLS